GHHVRKGAESAEQDQHRHDYPDQVRIDSQIVSQPHAHAREPAALELSFQPLTAAETAGPAPAARSSGTARAAARTGPVTRAAGARIRCLGSVPAIYFTHVSHDARVQAALLPRPETPRIR